MGKTCLVMELTPIILTSPTSANHVSWKGYLADDNMNEIEWNEEIILAKINAIYTVEPDWLISKY